MAASDGGIFAFGDAHFYGSTGGIHLAEPIVGLARALNGRGYWMAASDGGIFAFGSAHFYGSARGKLGGQRAVGFVASPDADGYWIASEGGGVDSASSIGMHIDPKFQPHGNEQAIATELVNRINTERAARGLHRLSVDPLLQSYASTWAHHLAATNTFDHQDLMVILRAANGRLEQAGENLFAAQGAGADDAGTAHNALMHSDPHRSNILFPQEKLVGIGAACVGDKLVVVEDFATPMGITLGSSLTPPLEPIAAANTAGATC
jgi:uncharacterized protein YkwD